MRESSRNRARESGLGRKISVKKRSWEFNILVELKILIRSLVLPPASLLTIGLIGILIGRYRPPLGRLITGLSLAILWILATPTVGFAIYRASESYPAVSPTAPLAAEAIVILGAGSSRPDSPEWGGYTMMDFGWDRVAYGAALARRSGLPVLITSTGNDALSMRASLLNVFGVQTRWLDIVALDTFENAHRAVKILQAEHINRIVLVTHSSHMRRSVQEFEAVGFRVLPAPVLVSPHPEPGVYAWIPTLRSLMYAHLGIYELVGRPVSNLLRRWRE